MSDLWASWIHHHQVKISRGNMVACTRYPWHRLRQVWTGIPSVVNRSQYVERSSSCQPGDRHQKYPASQECQSINIYDNAKLDHAIMHYTGSLRVVVALPACPTMLCSQLLLLSSRFWIQRLGSFYKISLFIN